MFLFILDFAIFLNFYSSFVKTLPIKTGPVKSQCPKIILVLVQHWLFLSDQ